MSLNSYKPSAIFTSMLSSRSWSMVIAVFLCILGLYALNHPHSKIPIRNALNDPRFEQIFLNSSSNYTLSSYLRDLTFNPHVAGTQASLQTKQYVETHFKDLGLQTHTAEFEVLLSYPVHASLSVHYREGLSDDLHLTEPGQVGRVVMPYHAYSPSGSAFAKGVFVNYGRDKDYVAVAALGVNVTGCVVIARRGDMSRGRVVEKAAEKGAVAVLLYTEGDVFGGVERGTVMDGIGDPLTPSWASVHGGEKLGLEEKEVKERFPRIPSMPISVENAETILRSLEGPWFPNEWRKDTLRSKVGRVGPGPTLLNFTYQEEKKMVTIHNIFAVIKGWEDPDRYVLLGNHRDAWTYGAVDPNSGTAALLDIARRYALLMHSGWTPRRTIVLCSWDAEEFGMVGSTEWVEQNLLNLGSKAVAYLNVDCAVQGPGFFARSTPQLDNLLLAVTKKIQRLSGVDSDFAPFLHHAGIPAADLYYGKDFPVYHTAFDSYDWMMQYGDPSFHRHVAVAGIWGLSALQLAGDSILPFDYLSYAAQLQEHASSLSNLLDDGTSLHAMTTSIQGLGDVAKQLEEEAKKLREQVTIDDMLVLKRHSLNDRLMLAERGFLDAEGLPGRPWFKHLVYGPLLDNESKLGFFPGVANAITQAARMPKREGLSAIQHEIWRVARAIQRATDALKGELI
ncbi:probable glutamate carboxypeptidase AMP1 isoform X2 [Macadamia integrifolia]|uniref:probable glutamate carboxypeptidase AMP1 isoform X2 n=1 Tax=Macadamia integrifolia TaxID=60698 RepID=UPI001C52CC5E|nr:probable glutamate carboxypeptidase AMP1 isoform X2 [Macadamia integrifolia]